MSCGHRRLDTAPVQAALRTSSPMETEQLLVSIVAGGGRPESIRRQMVPQREVVSHGPLRYITLRISGGGRLSVHREGIHRAGG